MAGSAQRSGRLSFMRAIAYVLVICAGLLVGAIGGFIVASQLGLIEFRC
jgi:hypothetical protein